MTGDEVISDSYNMKVIDDTVYEVDCKKVTLGADNFGQPSLRLPLLQLWLWPLLRSFLTGL